jgi:hypothetical protein
MGCLDYHIPKRNLKIVMSGQSPARPVNPDVDTKSHDRMLTEDCLLIL